MDLQKFKTCKNLFFMGFISFMKISTINIQNKYYNNLPAQKPVLNSSKVSDSFLLQEIMNV